MESNKNNNLRFVTLLILSSIFSINLSAFVPDDDETDIHISDINDPHRPRSVDQLHCYYQNGYVNIVGGNDITSINGTVTRQSDNMQWSNSSNSNMLQIAVPSDAGIYRLTFILSDGSSYYGDYVL
ncbi:MAG: hypothetical protein J6T18_09355 [Bacteroidaceae bacterium]|nr:hypothetical protein [Bacteroidaceae bacterium]